MDNDRIKGTAKQIKGSVKEIAGDVTGDTSLEIEGKIEKNIGKMQEGYGKAKDKLRED
jgi:uncharacterized protein YjbJ (UPF0337 family)